MKARYKILLVGNMLFLLMPLLAAAFFENIVNKSLKHTDPLTAILAVSVFIQFGILLYLFAILLLTLIAFWWARVKGKLEFIAASKIQLGIVLALIVAALILLETW
jgi:hypothetical protein